MQDRKRPVPSYDKIPPDAQVNAHVRLSYLTDLWYDHFVCSRCGRDRTEQGVKHDIVYYNQMIYLKDGKCYLAHPDLIYRDDDGRRYLAKQGHAEQN